MYELHKVFNKKHKQDVTSKPKSVSNLHGIVVFYAFPATWTRNTSLISHNTRLTLLCSSHRDPTRLCYYLLLWYEDRTTSHPPCWYCTCSDRTRAGIYFKGTHRSMFPHLLNWDQDLFNRIDPGPSAAPLIVFFRSC